MTAVEFRAGDRVRSTWWTSGPVGTVRSVLRSEDGTELLAEVHWDTEDIDDTDRCPVDELKHIDIVERIGEIDVSDQEEKPKREPKLSKAQERALREIRSPGGHGYGAYSYLTRRTAESLARLGLVVLGRKPALHRNESIPWAIAVGAEPPYGFRSRAEIKAADDAFLADYNARVAKHRAEVEARTERVLAMARERRRPNETDEEFADRMQRVERAVRASEKNLEIAERELGLRSKTDESAGSQDGRTL